MKTAKFLALLTTIALCVVLAVSVCAAEPVAMWDFADSTDGTIYNADGTLVKSPSCMDGAYDAEEACYYAEVNGGDPFISLPSRGEFSADNHYVKVKYKLTGLNNWSTSIYFTTDTVNWSETGHFVTFYDGDDDEWCEQIFDMSECAAWAGTVKEMRLDIFDGGEVGQTLKVAYAAVFATLEDAEAFDYAAYRTTAAPANSITEEEPEAEGNGTYLNLKVVKDAEVIDDDSTNDLGGSGNPIQIMDAYGVGYSSLNDMVVFNDVDFGDNGASSAKIHFGYGNSDGSVTTLAFYIDNPDGAPALEAEIGYTGGWDIASSGWVDIDFAVPAGIHTIYVKFTNEKSGSLSEISFYEAAPVAEPETTAEEPAAEPEAPAAEPETVEPAETEAPAKAETTADAPQTFDFGVIAAIVSIVSLAGCAVAKKH